VSLREILELARAQLALLRAQRRVARSPLAELELREPWDADDARGTEERAAATVVAIRRASRRGLFRPTCLVEAVALRDLLRLRGVQGASIRIGVRSGQTEIEAHAWVRWRGRILGDDPAHVACYVEVEDANVLRG
jgi:hypothetical protein